MQHNDCNLSLDHASILLIQALVDKIRPMVEGGLQDDDLSFELVRRTQMLAVESRLLYGRARGDTSREQCRDRLRELGYSCERAGSCVRIELPLLLPKRGGDVAFLTGPLHQLLSLEAGAGGERFRECVVIFQHIYGGDKQIHDIRDHDNIESRAVLNIIERFFLTSDSGHYCTNINLTESGRTSKTVITLLPGRLDLFAVKKAVTP